MSYFEFPHTRTYDNDLGWLIRHVKKVVEQMEDFINLNTIKYADPIEWNITTQYEANTVVIDPATGNAYISTKPVPAGVRITDTNYWTPIFNYDETINNLREQIVADNERDNEFAEQAKTAGELLWLNGILYRVTQDIPEGVRFIPGVNLEAVTVEQLLDEMDSKISDKLEADTEERTAAEYGSNIFNTGNAAEIMADNADNDTIRVLNFNLATQTFLNATIYDLNSFDRNLLLELQSMVESSGANIVGVEEQYIPTNFDIDDIYCDEVYTDANFESNFLPSFIAANGMYGSRYGNGIVTRGTQEDFTMTKFTNQASGDNPRSFLTAKMAYRGHTVKIYVVHITHLALETKLAQLDELYAAMTADDHPYIVCLGDFNLDYPFLTEKFMGSGFTVQNTQFNTFPASNPRASLDNILTKGFTASDVGTIASIDTAIFDHLGLYADLKFN